MFSLYNFCGFTESRDNLDKRSRYLWCLMSTLVYFFFFFYVLESFFCRINKIYNTYIIKQKHHIIPVNNKKTKYIFILLLENCLIIICCTYMYHKTYYSLKVYSHSTKKLRRSKKVFCVKDWSTQIKKSSSFVVYKDVKKKMVNKDLKTQTSKFCGDT